MRAAVLLAACGGIAACGAGGGAGETPVNIDYSALRLAPSAEGALRYGTAEEQLLRPLRNGLRMSLGGMPESAAVAGLTAPGTSAQGIFSSTTAQVDGVDEADLVKYDGRHLYTMVQRRGSPTDHLSRNVLSIARTDPATAQTQVVSEFALAGEQSSLPQLYQMQSAQGATEYLVAISQKYPVWTQPMRMTLTARMWADVAM